MIPNTNSLTTDLEVITQPSKSYKMYIDDNYINGTCKDLEEVKQTIYKILNTERYQYVIYSWNFGIELSDLIGEPIDYVLSEVERRITEALLQDDRIESVTDFEFDTSKRKEVVCTFVVHTIFGNVDEEMVVNA